MMKRPLFVQGTVRLRRDGHELRIVCEGDVIRLESPRLRDLRAWVQTLRQTRFPRSRSSQASASASRSQRNRTPIELADGWLRKADLRFEVRIADHTIARLGGEAKPTKTSRLLGLSPMEVVAGTLVWALFKW